MTHHDHNYLIANCPNTVQAAAAYYKGTREAVNTAMSMPECPLTLAVAMTEQVSQLQRHVMMMARLAQEHAEL